MRLSPNEVCIGVAVSVKKYLCRFYYSISQKVITLSGRRFITVLGGFITLSGSYYIIGCFLLHYRARITVSGVYYIIGWYTGHWPDHIGRRNSNIIISNVCVKSSIVAIGL